MPASADRLLDEMTRGRMNQPAKSHEPSMEEILASIRRIIADDEAPAQTAVVAAAAAALARPEPVPAPPATPKPAMAAPRPVLMPTPKPDPKPEPKVELKPEPIPEPPVIVPAPAPFVAIEPEPLTPMPAALSEQTADILELTEDMREEPPASRFRTIDAQPDVMFTEQAPAMPEPEPAMVDADPLETARQTLAEQMDRPLLSTSTTAAVDSAFASLTHTVLSQNARTLDDLVKEMLRPMLKSWLDDNLPGLVERLVRAEIERVSRGR